MRRAAGDGRDEAGRPARPGTRQAAWSRATATLRRRVEAAIGPVSPSGEPSGPLVAPEGSSPPRSRAGRGDPRRPRVDVDPHGEFPGPPAQQIVWLSSAATSFAALCERCLTDPERAHEALGYRAAKVEGSLRADADVRFIRCRRGHRLSVKRADRLAPPWGESTGARQGELLSYSTAAPELRGR